MAIKVGDKLPDIELQVAKAGGIEKAKTSELFGGKKTVLFAVPGAFTPTCSAKHLPGFIDKADEIRAKGVDQIVCISVNDAFVMGAWGQDRGAGDKVPQRGRAATSNGDVRRSGGLDGAVGAS